MYYFVSDVHLGVGGKEQARLTEQRFLRWLDMAEKDADTIFLLGDIFDFWFEYGHVVPKGYARIFGKLANITDKGIKIIFFTGNHDMWCRDYLHSECGIEIHRKPHTYTLAGKKIFIAHGDNMNIAGKPMLRLMNTCFRSKFLRVIFSWLIHPKAYKIFFSSILNFMFLASIISFLLFSCRFICNPFLPGVLPSVIRFFGMLVSWHYFPGNRITCSQSFSFLLSDDTERITK